MLERQSVKAVHPTEIQLGMSSEQICILSGKKKNEKAFVRNVFTQV